MEVRFIEDDLVGQQIPPVSRDIIVGLIKSRTAGGCPMCGGCQWVGGNHFVGVQTVGTALGVEAFELRPMPDLPCGVYFYPLVCDGCGFVAMYSTGILDLQRTVAAARLKT